MKDPELLVPKPFISWRTLKTMPDVLIEYFRNTFLGGLSCFQIYGRTLTLQQIKQVEFCPNRQGIYVNIVKQ